MEYQKYLTEKERAYNEVCGITLTHIFLATKNCDTIPIRDVDINNPEHLYVLHVAIGLGGAIDKKVTVNGSKFFLWKLNRKLGLKKDFRIQQMLAKDAMFSISPNLLNRDLRRFAIEVTKEEDFSYTNIYNEFYNTKGKK